MKANRSRFWVIVVLLGWMFDFLFWNKPLGVNFAIFVVLCLLTGILLLGMDRLHLAWRSGLLLLPIAFLAAVTFIRLEPMTVALAVVLVLFLMGILVLTYVSGEWVRYGLVDYFIGYLSLFASMIARPIAFAADNQRAEPAAGEKRSSRVWPILRGLVIALPVVAIFAALLSAADPIFANRFSNFIDVFKVKNLPEYIFRLVLILVVAYALAGVFLHALQKSAEKVEEKKWIPPFLGMTESTIVLGSVGILFVAFVIVQFQYFFGGQTNISVGGYTYSEYARKGFGELVAVAFFSLLLLLGLGTITRRDTETQRRTFSSLGVALVGLVIVMLVAAFQRLVLYEMAYGFSRLRTYTHVFMIWLGLLLVAVVVLEILRRERAAALVMILASLGFAVSLSVLNVDAFIVRQNIQRELLGTAVKSSGQGRADLDAQYFLNLSEDAVPPLVRAFHSESLPVAVKEKIGAALVCIRFEYKQNDRKYVWQSFHLSRRNADIALKQVSQELDAYDITTQIWPPKVETPSGEEFSCYQTYDD